MKTCKDCIYNEICSRYLFPYERDNAEKYCENFKDKSKFIELSCFTGDIIYVSVKGFKYPISFEVMGEPVLPIYHPGVDTFVKISEFGKIAFLTREEAEKKLGELK